MNAERRLTNSFAVSLESMASEAVRRTMTLASMSATNGILGIDPSYALPGQTKSSQVVALHLHIVLLGIQDKHLVTLTR